MWTKFYCYLTTLDTVDKRNSQYPKPRSWQKARTPCARRNMDLPLPFPSVCFHCICLIQKQNTSSQVLEKIPRYCQLSKEWYLPLSQHWWNKALAMKRAAKLVLHAKYRYNIDKTMHQEIDFFRKKAPTFVRHHLGNANPSHYTKNAHGNSFWGHLPGRCGRILN